MRSIVSSRLAGNPRAAVLLIAAVVAALGSSPAVAGGNWVAPVAGGVTRPFELGPNPFAGGQHRGADFAVSPGAPVRAACAGRVAVAGRVGSSGRVVTIRCGPWRVTHLPLAEVLASAGDGVRRGQRIGTAAATARHAGLHLGVRREGSRFGYADPLRFIGRHRPPVPVVPPPKVVRRPPRAAPPPAAPASSPASAPAAAAPMPAGPAVAAGPAPALSPVPTSRPGGAAPWPVWLGLALLLAGAVGAGVRLRPRRRLAPLARAAAREAG